MHHLILFKISIKSDSMMLLTSPTEQSTKTTKKTMSFVTFLSNFPCSPITSFISPLPLRCRSHSLRSNCHFFRRGTPATPLHLTSSSPSSPSSLLPSSSSSSSSSLLPIFVTRRTFVDRIVSFVTCIFSILRNSSSSSSSSSPSHLPPSPPQLGDAQLAPVYKAHVLDSFPHDKQAFTQGLAQSLDYENYLFESTGKYSGESSVRLVHIQTGSISRITRLSSNEFGEGLTVISLADNNHTNSQKFILQVLWKTGRAFLYNLNTLQKQYTFDLGIKDAWGVTTRTDDSNEVYISDGSPQIQIFRLSLDQQQQQQQNRISVTYVDTINVRDGLKPVGLLNELEFVNRKLWANVLMSKLIACINVDTGKVESWIDCRDILKPSDIPAQHKIDVLNGISYNRTKNLVYITGKYWPRLFAISPNHCNNDLEQQVSSSSSSSHNDKVIKNVTEIGNAFFLDPKQVEYVHRHILL